ncbi:MAG: uroporphyrinogen-III C-methyltransferase [Terriglobales bacterium]
MNSGVTGKVYLVGAGPGDPELLTLKALRVLREADVVLHDDLISEPILALIPRTAVIVSVGKRCGNARVTQEEINALMVAYARSGRTVVRLKSGDPMLFGRAGEELDALRTAGIEAEIVPGISVAFAAAAALETSLTDRRTAARVVFSTGHRASGGIEEGTTHVVYMPGPDYAPVVKRLLREAFSLESPCAVVSAVSLETQSVVRSTLGELPNMGPTTSPSILLVGEVLGQNTVQHHDRTRRDWQPTFSHQYGD